VTGFDRSASDRSTFARLAVLWLIGVDLRATLLAVPPVLPMIHRDLRLSETAVGGLTSLPVLVLAAAAVPGSLLIARAGARRAVVFGLLVVAVSSVLRGAGPSVGVLFAMTLVMGGGIALMQPAVPALVARWCSDRIGFATALSVNGLLVGETLSAALTLPFLPLVHGRWPAALAVWAILPLGTAVVMAGLGRRLPDALPESPAGRPRLRGTAARDARPPAALWWPDWRAPDTWRLALVLGGVGTVYFGTNAFIPDYVRAAGRGDLIGPCLTALNASQLPASFIALAVAGAVTGRRAPLLAVPAGSAVSLALFLAAGPAWWVAASGLIGFFTSFGLVLTIALPPLLVEDRDVHRLSAGMFAVGYGYSFVLPLIGGAVWDLSHVPASAFFPVFAGTATTLAAGLGLPRDAAAAAYRRRSLAAAVDSRGGGGTVA
jgi:CP family cyanate transporter-like MFS transporter